METKLAKYFVLSAGFILLATSLAKLISGLGHSGILSTTDPVFKVTFGTLFWLVGMLELVVAFVCFFGRHLQLKIWLVFGLATGFGLYRLALWHAKYHRSCPCLGNLTDSLGIDPRTADVALKVLFFYLMLGSLFALWLVHCLKWRNGHGRLPTNPASKRG